MSNQNHVEEQSISFKAIRFTENQAMFLVDAVEDRKKALQDLVDGEDPNEVSGELLEIAELELLSLRLCRKYDLFGKAR